MEKGLGNLRQEILGMVKRFQKQRELEQKSKIASSTRVPVSGKVFDDEDVASLVDASLDFWLTAGRFADAFEAQLAAYMGLKHALMVNSGSSANLVALCALTSKFLGSRRLKKGAEVITTATSFPTTVNPIFQNNMTPVFLDVELDTYNIDLSRIEEAICDKTGAVFVAHTLGNPFDVAKLSDICKKHGLFLIEDCCDALGATANGKMVGTYGDFATLSFYPAHHITTGEGGAVLTGNDVYKRAAESFRDWGRDCWCKPGVDNTCGRRFKWKLGDLPYGYDHKYIYSNIGYNLKATDMQAAVGITQLKKLPGFVKARLENFNFYLEFFKQYEDYFILPRSYPGCKPSPFGYLVNIKADAPFKRGQLVECLESSGIATRMLFGGNITRQPAYKGKKYKAVGGLENADHIMNNAFWIGVYPGIDGNMRQYVASVFEGFLKKHKKG
ncbi:lipopolysaccharide biosynthesis protein RfbH [Candidatus Parvarchaeota archaeon]|nr:lipopolysaccharide biosynthesis protein RfbH [Candidatus Parvarchaeota archaeon]